MFALQNPADELSQIDRDPWNNSMSVFNRPIDPAPGEYPSPRKKCMYNDYCENFLHASVIRMYQYLNKVKQ